MEARRVGAGRIICGVTGGIALYKTCDLIRSLVKHGIDVHVVMTASAARLVTPVTFYTLTYNPVITDLFSLEGKATPHISLVQDGDVLVVAPATANIIGKAAHGIADDPLSTTLMAFNGPCIVAPAMNWRMWQNPILQDNLARLRRVGYRIIEPDEGELACRETGQGRMAPLDAILKEVLSALDSIHPGTSSPGSSSPGSSTLMKDVRVLVTAGATREFIDPVRYISNRASGELGHMIGREFAARGARVILVTAADKGIRIPDGIDCVRVQTARDMSEAVTSRFSEVDIVVASAGVCDWRPGTCSEEKIKKAGQDEHVMTLVRNPDVLAELVKRKRNQILVGFAAESNDLVVNARLKLENKNLDLIVANDILDQRTGPGRDMLKPVLVFRDGRLEHGASMSKQEWARRLVKEIEALVVDRS